jgi:HAD superfamily hydrolase (TIGR01509 family)
MYTNHMLIVWDYFGVIAQDAFWYTADRLAKTNGLSEEMRKAQHESDLGQISWDDYTQLVAHDIGVNVLEVRKRYQDHDIKRTNILAIHELKEHTHVLLSNASAEYLLPIMHKLGLDSIFADVFVSSAIGYAKPDERAFRHVLDVMNVEPEGAIMIDDSARNIDAARSFGMSGIIFGAHTNILAEIRKITS